MKEDTDSARVDFEREMYDIYQRAKKECHYTASRFFEMLGEYGGVGTAKRLLATSSPSEGYTRLWKCGRLDLTVEAHVLDGKYAELFTEEEKSTAKTRLQEYKYEL